MQKNFKADDLAGSSLPECQTKATAIPIKVYNMVHAGPKIHEGGLNEGLTKPSNQDISDGPEVNPEARPSPRHKTTLIRILTANEFKLLL